MVRKVTILDGMINQLDMTGIKGAELHSLVGKAFMHTGNQCIYEVTAIVWCGDDDLWYVEHQRNGEPTPTVRSSRNFTGERENGEKRFVEVRENPAGALR